MLFQAGNEVKYLTVTDVFIRLDANVGHMFMRVIQFLSQIKLL